MSNWKAPMDRPTENHHRELPQQRGSHLLGQNYNLAQRCWDKGNLRQLLHLALVVQFGYKWDCMVHRLGRMLSHFERLPTVSEGLEAKENFFSSLVFHDKINLESQRSNWRLTERDTQERIHLLAGYAIVELNLKSPKLPISCLNNDTVRKGICEDECKEKWYTNKMSNIHFYTINFTTDQIKWKKKKLIFFLKYISLFIFVQKFV